MYQFLHPLVFLPLILLGFLFVKKIINVRNLDRKGILMLGRVDKFFRKNFIHLDNSTIIWNVIFWVLFIGTTLVYPEIGNMFAIVTSLYWFFVIIFEDDLDRFDKHTWAFASYFFIFCIIIVSIGHGLYKAGSFIYKNTITRFNNWVNNF